VLRYSVPMAVSPRRLAETLAILDGFHRIAHVMGLQSKRI
jgi:hypothetical protein